MTLQDSRIPAAVKPLFQNYLDRLNTDFPELIFGVYLQGSIVYDAFCEEISDIDVLTVTNRACNQQDLDGLRELHADIKQQWPEWKFEVSYVPLDDCRDWRPGVSKPHPYHHQDPYHDEAIFYDSGIFDFNSPVWAPNLWWMVKTQSIALMGPPASALDIQISADDVVATNRYLVENYWPDWLRPGSRLLSLRVPFELDWVVLGSLRTLYTLSERDITSKTGAADYGFKHLPKRWHWLIRYSLAQRFNPERHNLIFRSVIGLLAAVYLAHVLRRCRQIMSRD